MRYFKVDTLGDSSNNKLAIIDKPPEGTGSFSYCFTEGESAVNMYPANPKTRLNDYPGFKLSSLLGNVLGFFTAETLMKNSIEKAQTGDIEFFPFTILDHKGNVLSSEYWIINPLGSFDVLDTDNSKVKRGRRTNEIVGVREFAFHGEKLVEAPDIFRIPEDLSYIFVSEVIASLWAESACTNVYLKEVVVT